MRIFLAFGALALLTQLGFAADGCTYVHESKPDQWIRLTDGGLIWHKDGEAYVFDTSYVDEKTTLRGASTPEGVDPAQDAWYRLAEVDGRKTLIFETVFFYEDCAIASK